jgi:flagellar hook-associated protein 3 FlgL
MTNGIDSSAQRFLTDLATVQARSEKAQRQLSSGLRISVASDSPDEISRLLQVRVDLMHNTQVAANLGRVKTEVDAAEQALSDATTLTDQIKVLGTQALNGTQTPSENRILGDQISALMDRLVSIANTSVDGRHIFSGDSDQAGAYSLDATQPNGVSPYGGSATTRQAQHPGGTTFSISKTAQEIFDDPSAQRSVFGAVNALRNALTNNDADGIRTAMGNLGTAAGFLNSKLAFYGNVQNQVQGATDFASKQDLRLKTELSGLQDADLTQAITDLTQAKFTEQAAMQARAAVPKTSLFDYLFR